MGYRELIINARDYLYSDTPKEINAYEIANILEICTRMRKELIILDLITMKDILKALRNRKSIQLFGENKQRQQIQLNKKADKVCWERYNLPSNGDKSKAIKINEFLNLKEVIDIVERSKEILKNSQS